MVTAVKIFLTFVCTSTMAVVLAQKPKPVVTKPAIFEKFTPPKLISQLGIRSDTVSVFLEEAKQLVKIPLKVTDGKKNNYTIASYHVQYRRRAVTEDEQTGKVSPIISSVSDFFKETPIPNRWSNILVEQMRVGEELFFYDIVAKDAAGRLMFAPVILIKIKK